jgi:hypothetical protein
MADGVLLFELYVVLHVIQIQADAGQLSEQKEVFGSSSTPPFLWGALFLLQYFTGANSWPTFGDPRMRGKNDSPPTPFPPQPPRAKNDSA